MDLAKCNTLKQELAAQAEPQLVSIERFLDGNDDIGSIGCNLMEHPGVDAFSQILAGLLRRPDVEAVYAQITEADPGDDCWPFTDTLFIVGPVSVDELRQVLSPLQPNTVGTCTRFLLPAFIRKHHQTPVMSAWWD